MDPSQGPLVTVATVRRPWGTGGAVAVTAYADELIGLRPGVMVRAGDDTFEVAEVKRAGSGYSVRLTGVNTPEQAARLRGKELQVKEADLPPTPHGVYYHYQLLGARVVDVSGNHVGTLVEIIETPANDVYVVRPDGSKPELLLPATVDVIKKVDTVSGTILIRIPQQAEDNQ